jgi:Glycosyltransferase 61
LEGTTFQEQVEFFQSVDILISGHGAQLTGLPFMADNYGSSSSKSCKQVVELYPKHYALPYYFGSLAHQAGMAHSYMYMTDNQTDIVLPWEIRNGATYQERFHARKAKLCPRPDAMVEAMVELIHDWHACMCPQQTY